MMPLFKGEVKLENPYYPYEVKKNKNKRPIKLKEEGIYIFGGAFSNGEATNKLKIIKLGFKPIKYLFPE